MREDVLLAEAKKTMDSTTPPRSRTIEEECQEFERVMGVTNGPTDDEWAAL